VYTGMTWQSVTVMWVILHRQTRDGGRTAADAEIEGHVKERLACNSDLPKLGASDDRRPMWNEEKCYHRY
jgi:hypothetical protein